MIRVRATSRGRLMVRGRRAVLRRRAGRGASSIRRARALEAHHRVQMTEPRRKKVHLGHHQQFIAVH